MTTAGWVSLAIIIFGAFSYATAAILQALAARRSNGTVQTMSHPFYLLGIGFDILAWVGSMIALRELAVYLVETILAGSLAITVVAARFILKSRLRRRDVAAIVVSMLALTVLAMSAGPQHEVHVTNELRIGFCVAAAVIATLGWLATKGAPAGVIAAFGGLSLGSAALVGRALPGGMMNILLEPLTAALLVFAGAGMLLYANALGRGDVGPVTAVHWTAEVVAPSAVALILLGDAVRPGWELAAGLAGLLTVGSAVLLATAPANPEAAVEPAALEAAPQPALPAAAPEPQPATPYPRPALPARDPHGDRVIWWGPPPIWRPPPSRARPALASRSLPALEWSPPVTTAPVWTPRRPGADPVEVPSPTAPGPGLWTEAEPMPEPAAPLRPWHDL
ncbi:MAG: hypothetical protein ABW046_04750 [Actinoplanes sp.]